MQTKKYLHKPTDTQHYKEIVAMGKRAEKMAQEFMKNNKRFTDTPRDMDKPILTCLSFSCPERRSICCGAITEPEPCNGYFRCSNCKKPYVGGECTAGEDTPREEWEKEIYRYIKNACESYMLMDRGIIFLTIKPEIEKLLSRQREELIENILKGFNKYKCDFNWDFDKNKEKHKEYIALSGAIKVIREMKP